jgi:hypothetical protein
MTDSIAFIISVASSHIMTENYGFAVNIYLFHISPLHKRPLSGQLGPEEKL